MSKKICFSSVLKQKRGTQNTLFKQNFPQQNLGSLRNYMEEFLENPVGQYRLKYPQINNLRTYNSRNGFDEGYNQLDQWISQKINSNKQNIYEAQSRRQIPNELSKYIKGGKSPRKVSQTKNDFSQNHKNMDIKQICKQYAQSKKSGRESQREPPVWKFLNRKQQQQTNEQEVRFREREKDKQVRCVIKQPIKNSTKYRAPDYQATEQSEENEGQFKQKIGNSTGNFNGISNGGASNQNRSQTHHIMKIVEQIKNNMIPEIQVMAERIIKDRNSVNEDEEMLINDRGFEQKKEPEKDIHNYLRLQNARKQIGEYLIMKNGVSFDKIIKQSSIPTQSKANFDGDQQKILSSNNIGYSFSSDFQIPITSKQSMQNNTNYEYQNKLLNQVDSRKKQKTSTISNKISLPNIDEVKSQRDANEKIDELIDSVAVTLKNRKLESHTPSIDRNFIKEIQSVAYVQESNGKIASSKIHALEREIDERIRENSEKKATLLQQITKTALSIDGGIQEDSQQVNISIAEGKMEQKNSIKQESPKKIQEPVKFIQTNSNKQSSVLPANTIKIEFKKIPSSEHLDKLSEVKTVAERTEGVKETAKQPNASLQNNPASEYFGLAYSNNLRNEGTLSRKNSVTQAYATNNSRSSANALQQPEKQIKKQHFTTLANNGINQNTSPVIFNQNTNNLNGLQTYSPNQNITFTNLPSNTTTTNLSNQPYPSQIVSSKQRLGEIDQGKKIKITISPKYLGHQHDKHESIGNVADFKLNTRVDESTQTSKYTPKASSISQNTSNNNFNIIQASQTNHIKVDTLFTNVSNIGNKIVTETRHMLQEYREKGQQNGMIKIQKYQKIEKLSQPMIQNHAPHKIASDSISPSIQFGGYTTTKTGTTNLGSQTSNNNTKNKPMNSIKNNESVKSSEQFEFDLDF